MVNYDGNNTICGICVFFFQPPNKQKTTLQKSNIAMENGPFEDVFLLEMGVLHGYVSLPEGKQKNMSCDSSSFWEGNRWIGLNGLK